MDAFADMPFLDILNTLPDGVIVFQNGRAAIFNKRASEILGADPKDLSLFGLLQEADIDLLQQHPSDELLYHCSIGLQKVALSMRQTDAQTVVVTLKEDTSAYAPIPFPQDEEDLDWLRAVSARLALFAITADRLPPAQFSEQLRSYADQLQKYVSNGDVRAVGNAELATAHPVGISFSSLLPYVIDASAEQLAEIGVHVIYQQPKTPYRAVVFGSPQFFLKLIYNAIDALVYHCREHDNKAPVEIRATNGFFAGRVYFELAYNAVTPFPSNLQAMRACQAKNPSHYSQAYAADIKLIFAVSRIYGGLIVSHTDEKESALRIYFPQTTSILSSPYNFADAQVYPETEMADILCNPHFRNAK